MLKNELQNLSQKLRDELDQTMDRMEGAMPAAELRMQLDVSEKGRVLNSRLNCVRIFRHDERLYRRFRFNILAQCVCVLGDVPWERKAKGEALANSDLRAIHLYIEEHYGINHGPTMDEALYRVADENEYHPVQEYLKALGPWDGTPRVRYAIHRFLGADTSDYTCEVLKLFMLGAISRAFSPGIKFDYMLCLSGGQGIGKSSFLRLLCVKDEWFCDDLKNLETKDVYEKLQGHWIIEMSEMLAAVNSKTNETIKAFLSRQKDTYRIPYDKISEDRPRQCVFSGTTNRIAFLPDDRTGNRRFLPVFCDGDKREVFILANEQESRAYIEQMWAEVMEIYRKEKPQLRFPEEMEYQLQEKQKQFSSEDTYTGRILDFMLNTKEDRVCSLMLFREALGNVNLQPRRSQTNEVCEIVNQLIDTGHLPGWRAFTHPKRFRKGYGTQRGWERIPFQEIQDVNE